MTMREHNASQRGFTYLAILFWIMIVSASLSVGGVVWHTAQQREREQELLFIGDQFRRAIASFYYASPGIVRRYPTALSDLLKDPRFPNTRRHLRRVYLDPMTGEPNWGLIRGLDGGIIGVHSLSESKPIRTSFQSGPNKEFTGKQRYRDWVFVFLPAVPGPAPVQSPGAVPRQRTIRNPRG